MAQFSWFLIQSPFEQHVEQAAVEPTGGAIVDILGHGMMTQLCLAKTKRQAPVQVASWSSSNASHSA